jgi:hypothetical protein
MQRPQWEAQVGGADDRLSAQRRHAHAQLRGGSLRGRCAAPASWRARINMLLLLVRQATAQCCAWLHALAGAYTHTHTHTHTHAHTHAHAHTGAHRGTLTEEDGAAHGAGIARNGTRAAEAAVGRAAVHAERGHGGARLVGGAADACVMVGWCVQTTAAACRGAHLSRAVAGCSCAVAPSHPQPWACALREAAGVTGAAGGSSAASKHAHSPTGFTTAWPAAPQLVAACSTQLTAHTSSRRRMVPAAAVMRCVPDLPRCGWVVSMVGRPWAPHSTLDRCLVTGASKRRPNQRVGGMDCDSGPDRTYDEMINCRLPRNLDQGRWLAERSNRKSEV